MKVKELMEQLSNLDPELQVMIDVTKEGSEMFHFTAVVEVEEIELEGSEKIVAVFSDEAAINFDNLNDN